MNFNALLNSAVKVGRKWAPVVLLAAGTVLAVDAIVKTPECYEESNEIIVLEERKAEENSQELTPMEKVKLTWKSWLPVIWREGVSLFCFYAAFHMKHKRGAAIAAAYTLLERERDELDLALHEALGDRKYESKRHEIMNKKIEGALATQGENLVVGPEDALAIYYEPISGKIFKADPKKVTEAVKTLDERYGFDGFVSLAEFFKILHLDPPVCGDYIGWQYDEGQDRHITYKTYDYHWAEKDIYITGLDMGLRLDKFVRTWW